MSRNVSPGSAADDDRYSDKNMKKARDATGTSPGEFSPPSREEPYVPDGLPAVMNRAALTYPYDPEAVELRRVR